MSFVKDMSDIPLKSPQQTFVDEPTSSEEVHIDELIFDLRHNLKDINKLHVYHAIAILSAELNDLIKLQSNTQLFTKFRAQQLAKYNINLEEMDGGLDDNAEMSKITRTSTPTRKSSTPPISPPLKFAKLKDNFKDIRQDTLKETTPDSLSNENERILADEFENEEDGDEEYEKTGTVEDPKEPPYIPIEELVRTTSLEVVKNPITDHSYERLQKELFYHQAIKVKQQNIHLLKIFNLVKVPPLSIEQFLIRMKTYASSISVSSYIHSAYLMFKLCLLLDIVPLTKFNVYRFILGSIRCSTKKLEDVYQKQKYFATVGGVSGKDLFKIEVGFLYLSNFKLVVGEKILNFYLKDHFIELHDFCKENFESSHGDEVND